MLTVVTAEEFRRVDRAYEGDLGEAMERAGHAVALAAVRHGAGYGSRVVVLAGGGNNGGDGYVAARYLARRGANVVVHALTSPRTDISRAARTRAVAAGVRMRELGLPVAADLVIDAVFGGGARGGLPGSVLAWMETTAPVIGVDFPTGLDPDSGRINESAFDCVETVTFGCLKTGHVLGQGPDRCGRVTVADIGIQGGRPSLFVAEESDAPRPSRERKAHKWSAGSVLVLGGSPGMVGAAVLAGRAALDFGAGTVVVSSSQVETVQRAAPELLAYTFDQAAESIDRFEVCVAGPGLDADDETAIRPLLAKARKVVLDAGGLTRASLDAAREGDSEVVVTPHDREFERVAGAGAGTYSVRSFATRAGVTVLRKGNPTMVSDGGLPVLVTTGGPELASIGTGDVLAGMIGALWARGLSPFDATISAAYWHGQAGASLAQERTVTAAGLVEHVGRFAW